MTAIEDIKANLKEKKLAIGTTVVMKLLRNEELATVYLSSNCPDSVKSDVEKHASMSKCKVEHLDIPNEELGVVCRKPFAISIVGLLK